MSQQKGRPTDKWLKPLVNRVQRWLARRRVRRRALQALTHAEPGKRIEAARFLATTTLSPSEIHTLIQAMDDPNPFVRWEIGEALIAQGPRHVLGACLRRVYEGREGAGIAAAVRVLGVLGDERALPALVQLTEHPDPEVRVALAHALRAFAEHPSAQEALHALLRDDHPTVRRATIWTLRDINVSWAHRALAQRASEEPVSWLRHLLRTAPVATEEATS